MDGNRKSRIIDKISKLRSLPRVLNGKEKIVFIASCALFIVSSIVLLTSLYLSRTDQVPTFGGSYTEGMVGYPRFLNPIYSPMSDVDRDTTFLLFSSLIDYDFSKGSTSNLVDEILEDGETFRLRLKDDLKWSDGERITSDDLIFTIKTIQDPEYRSPLRPDWVGVDVEKLSDLEVIFKLEQRSAVFENKLSLKIIPSHIWKDISPQNFPFSGYNIVPIGSGPYRVKDVIEDQKGNVSSLLLEPNPFYHGKKPYIEDFSIIFYEDESQVLTAAGNGIIDGFAKITPKDYQEVFSKTNFKIYRYRLPRYFALFFNLEREAINKEIREALEMAIDKDVLVESVLAGRGERVDSAILPKIYGFNSDRVSEYNPSRANEILNSNGLNLNGDLRSTVVRDKETLSFEKDLNTGDQGDKVRDLQKCLIYLSESDSEIFPDGGVTGFYGQDTRDAVIRFQEKYREEILDPNGFKQGTGMVSKSTRAKLNEVCSEIPEIRVEPVLRITTIDQSLMSQTADLIKTFWENIGIKTEIETYDRVSLERDVIKPRDYDILLFGKAFEAIPDLFPFWHSSQKSEFGLNLTMYQNDEVDKLTEESRISFDESLLERIDELIVDDLPAIFLYNPDYLYFISPRISGINSGRIINPSNRFLGVENWYVKTKRLIRK